jgi:hypothetical protein
MFVVRWSVIYLVMVGAALVSAVCMPAPEADQPALRIQIPEPIAPEEVTIIGGIYGNGLSIGQLYTRAGVREYPIYGEGKVTEIRLLLYHPAYRAVTVRFIGKDAVAGSIYTPNFEKLRSTSAPLRVVDNRGKPVSGQRLRFSIDLDSHLYFHYFDGMEFSALAARAITNHQGECTVVLPYLPDDPYFAASGREAQFSIAVKTDPDGESHITPKRIPLQEKYAEPVTITRFELAHLYGRIEKGFLDRHEMHGDVTPYSDPQFARSPQRIELRVEEKKGYGGNAMLMPDGSFSVRLPPGEYDLRLVSLPRDGGTLVREAIIQEGLILKPGEERKLIFQ